jgi:hypothetical protein
VTETPVVTDESRLTAEPTPSLGAWAKQVTSEQGKPSVYAAYWQARSGFFAPPPKSPGAGIDVVRSGPP